MKNERVPIGLLVLSVAIGFNVGTYKTVAQNAALSKEQIAALLVKAKAGDVESQWLVGSAYEDGHDYVNAAIWLRKAATSGNVLAQDHLAYLYEQGNGVPQDDAKAAFWVRKAAERGDPWAQSSLGTCYSEGQGVPQDDKLAAFWWRKAAAQGNEDARRFLAETHPPKQDQQKPQLQNHIVVGSSHDIAQNAFKSVVLLQMNDANGQPLSLGSGFFVSNGIVATNAHVIEGASSGTAKLVGDSHEMQILGTVAIDHHADLALLKVNSSAPSLVLGPSTNPSVGDNVYVVGNPLGLEGTFSEGIISGIRTIGGDTILQMTAPISPGSSGGPVMDSSGAVIGIAVAQFTNGQNLNLAMPAIYLSKLLASMVEPVTVSPLGHLAHDASSGASIVDGLGSPAESGVVASNFDLFWGGEEAGEGGYSLRISNKLPVDVEGIYLRIIYYDASSSVMDFENYLYSDTIPSGLTKTVVVNNSAEAGSAYFYYSTHGPKGEPLAWNAETNQWGPVAMKPKVEIRIVSFQTEESR